MHLSNTKPLRAKARQRRGIWRNKSARGWDFWSFAESWGSKHLTSTAKRLGPANVILDDWEWLEASTAILKNTVPPCYNEPRYNEDPVITNNIWKPARITVQYVETNPAITKSPL